MSSIYPSIWDNPNNRDTPWSMNKWKNITNKIFLLFAQIGSEFFIVRPLKLLSSCVNFPQHILPIWRLKHIKYDSTRIDGPCDSYFGFFSSLNIHHFNYSDLFNCRRWAFRAFLCLRLLSLLSCFYLLCFIVSYTVLGPMFKLWGLALTSYSCLILFLLASSCSFWHFLIC